jgi:PAS domain S-box-containing protein
MTLKDLKQESDKESPNKYTEEMELNEKHLSIIYDTLSDMVFLLAVEPDDCFRFVSVNQAFFDVTGLSREQVVGKRIEQVLPETAHALVISKYKEAIVDNKTVFWEQASTFPTGERVGAVTVTPVRNAGVCTHLIGTMHDLTETRQAEAALFESEEKFRLLTDNSIDCIWMLDTKLRFTYLSPSSERILGYKPEQMVGTNLSSHFKIKEFLKVGALAAKAIKNYKTFTHVTFQTKMLNSKNDEVDLEISSKGLLNSQGKLIGLYGTTRDITERKQADEALRESEERFRTIFDSINDAVFIHDIETGAILDVNSTMCEMYGYSQEEVDQLDIQALSSGEVPYTQQDALEWNKKAAMGEAQVFEWMAKHKSGHLFWVEVSMKKAVVGLQERLLVVVRDITERKQAEAELQKLNEELEQRVKERTAELEEMNAELEQLNKVFVGRELRMIELKKQIAELEKDAEPDQKAGDETT